MGEYRMQAHGIAAISADAPLQPMAFDRRSIEAGDVAIKINYCGVCHSDLHIAKNDWGMTNYPIILGHEIVGEVTAVGDAVTKFRVGDKVAVGCLVDSCQSCKPCDQSLEQYCTSGYIGTINGADKRGGITQGGFSDKIIVREEFVLRLGNDFCGPDVAPLLCAGVTTYSALRHWKTQAGTRVGVIGLGGLGHIAVKLAKAMGAEVTVVTRTADKAEDALKLGADKVIIGSGWEDLGAHGSTLDLLINTVSAPMALDPYLNLLDLNGTMVLLGGPAGSHEAPSAWVLEGKRRSLAGSSMAGIAETQELLDFCAEHGVTCDIELVDATELNTAFDRLERGDVKFRFVADMRNVAAA